MMDKLIAQFPEQLREALEIGQTAHLKTVPTTPIHNVVLAGLGGSAMGGDVVIDLLRDTLRIPMLVNRDYHLPAFVNEKTLVIVSSYSGNTEETVSALKLAQKRKAVIVCITSGGQIAEIARNNNLDLILLPNNSPSPRACLGYSFVQQLFILQHFGLIDDAFIQQINEAANLLEKEQQVICKDAQKYGQQLFDKVPIIYAPDGYESVAIRWRQQFNENSKMLCWHHVVPEMNHNELVGWRKLNADFAPIFFQNADTFSRNASRITINEEIIQKYTSNILSIHSKGNNKYERMLYLIHLGDWISWYMAQARNVDALEVDVIDYLKRELRKL